MPRELLRHIQMLMAYFCALKKARRKRFPMESILIIDASKRSFTNRRYLDAIEDHIVIFDGAMGASIQSYDLNPADYGGRTLPT